MQPVITPPVRPVGSTLLVATPRLEDPNFARAVILMLEHGGAGSLGVVLNRTSDTPVAEVLPSWGERAPGGELVRLGGPVEPDALLAVAVTMGPSEGCTPVGADLALVDLDMDPLLMGPTVATVRFFAGYAGWGPGQLGAELQQGAWWVFPSRPGDLDLQAPSMWSVVVGRQRSPAALLSRYPDHPSEN